MEKFVTIKITKKNIEYFIDKGYDAKLKENLTINTLDLQPKSEKKIKCSCDYCGKEIIKMFCDYIKSPEKISCAKCKYKKAQETIKNKYGVNNVMYLTEVKNKIKNTCLEKYGVENPMQLKEVQEKIKATNLQRYGVDISTKNPIILEKVQKTMQERYGVKSAIQNEEIKQKIKNTNLKKYGVDNPMKNEPIKQKQRETCLEKYGNEYPIKNREILKRLEDTNLKRYGVKYYTQTEEMQKASRVKGRNNAPYSKAQKYICDLYKGELNYPYDRCYLDIFFPEYNIYCEYDGGGHNYSVRIGELTQEQFDEKEKRRYYYLHKKGLKEFRIKSKKDCLPSDTILLEMKNLAFNILNNNISSYIIFDIDNSEVEWKNNKQHFNF